MPEFKLQSVLNYRKLLEDVSCQEFAERLTEEQRLAAAVKEERAKLDELHRTVEERRLEGIAAQELWLLEEGIRHQGRVLKKAEERLAQAHVKTEEKRAALQEASRKRRLMDKLKEHHDENEAARLQQRERNEIDEIAVLFHKR
ncbi:MAG: flagellar export protein FliJ [Deltaproteobacteria bacterium]|nr:flagellar export protein FliJ [Deltaproteobacteria bacterium]